MRPTHPPIVPPTSGWAVTVFGMSFGLASLMTIGQGESMIHFAILFFVFYVVFRCIALGAEDNGP